MYNPCKSRTAQSWNGRHDPFQKRCAYPHFTLQWVFVDIIAASASLFARKVMDARKSFGRSFHYNSRSSHSTSSVSAQLITAMFSSPWPFSTLNDTMGRSTQPSDMGRRTSPFLSNGTENSYDDLHGVIHSTPSYSSIHSHGEDRSPLGDITLHINRVE